MLAVYNKAHVVAMMDMSSLLSYSIFVLNFGFLMLYYSPHCFNLDLLVSKQWGQFYLKIILNNCLLYVTNVIQL